MKVTPRTVGRSGRKDRDGGAPPRTTLSCPRKRASTFGARGWTPAFAGVTGIVVFLASLLAACGGEGEPPPTAAPSPTPAAEAVPAPSNELRMAFAVTDLSVGTNRVAFGLIDRDDGPLGDAEVELSTYFLVGETQEGPLETVPAVFRRWPVGAGGVYTAHVTFDRSGRWGLAAVAVGADGSRREASAPVDVVEESLVPQVGSPAPRSETKRARDVYRLEEMTTDPDPDPELYSMSVAEALDAGAPLVVTFSTPGYCQTATCGPQLEVVKALKRDHGGRAGFIHVEVYDNPLEIQGDLRRARVAPAVSEWRLPSEPWTFVVDAGGVVRARFEGFATREELELALLDVLE